MSFPGPTGNLKGTARRLGRSGTVWIAGQMHGEISGLRWGSAAANIAVPIPGKWADDGKPGGEDHTGSFSYHDVDDRWRLFVWRFFEARKNGDREAAKDFPRFDIIEKIDDIGAPAISQWGLIGCQLFGLEGGHDQSDTVLARDVEFRYEEARPLYAFEYTDSGIAVTQA